MALSRSYQIDYFCGWRYLFSANYRNHAKQKWGNNLLLKSLFLVANIFSILLTSAATVLLIQLVWFVITNDISG